MSVPLSIVKEITDATSNDLVSTYGYSSMYADYFSGRDKTQAQFRIFLEDFNNTKTLVGCSIYI